MAFVIVRFVEWGRGERAVDEAVIGAVFVDDVSAPHRDGAVEVAVWFGATRRTKFEVVASVSRPADAV